MRDGKSNVVQFPDQEPHTDLDMDGLPLTVPIRAGTYRRLVNAADLFDCTVAGVLERLVTKGLGTSEAR